jgi:protein ImuB
MNTPSRRYLSVWMRRLPTDRIAKHDAPDEALVIAAPVKSALRLSAVNDAAAALGLTVGMPLADARARYPKIAVAEADETADLALLEAIADWCDRYTPLVGLDAPDGLTLDISGCAHLFGGEAALAADIVRRLGTHGLQARVAVAGTVGCAWGVARCSDFLPSPERGRHRGPTAPVSKNDADAEHRLWSETSRVGIHSQGRIVASGGERNALSPLPLAALRLTPDVIEALAQVGLKRIADVLDRPRAPLAARFNNLMRRLDQALGIADEPITPRLPIPSAIVEQRFNEPIALERDVLGTIERLAARLAPVLEQRGEGARLLQVALFRTDGKVFRIQVGTGEPLREPARVARLFAERLDVINDEIDPGFGFDVVRLCALVTERSDPQQTGLAAPDHTAELAHLIDRLGARFGLRRVTRLIEQDTHIPEYAAMAVGAHMVSALAYPPPAQRRGGSASPAFSRGGGSLALQSPRPPPHHSLRSWREGSRTPARDDEHQDSLAPTRPIRLFTRPEPVEALAEVPDGPPVRFRWRRMLHEVVHVEGPERIATEWWSDETGCALTRDYFRVESREGVRVWVFREGLFIAGGTTRWFVHGVFA